MTAPGVASAALESSPLQAVPRHSFTSAG